MIVIIKFRVSIWILELNSESSFEYYNQIQSHHLNTIVKFRVSIPKYGSERFPQPTSGISRQLGSGISCAVPATVIFSLAIVAFKTTQPFTPGSVFEYYS